MIFYLCTICEVINQLCSDLLAWFRIPKSYKPILVNIKKNEINISLFPKENWKATSFTLHTTHAEKVTKGIWWLKINNMYKEVSYIKRQYLIKTKGHLGYHIMNLKINSTYEITNNGWFQQLDQNSLLPIWTTFLTPPPDTRILWPPDVRRDKQLTKLQTNKIWLVSI